MKQRKPILLLLMLFGLCVIPGFMGMQRLASRSTLILISLDGVGWEYPEKFGMSHLLRLGSEGVRAGALVPVYPTETFPSHYSMVTGLYPEDHGLISNTMYDPLFEAVFRIRDRQAVADPRWWGGEPIWATAKRQGLVTAAYFWPGTDVEIGGMRPDYWYPFDPSVSRQERIAQLFRWLEMPPADRPAMITQYFGEVDKAGHDFGPEASQTRRAAAQVDETLGDILRGIEERGLKDEVNLMVVSDHGMAEVPPHQVIFLEDYVNPNCCRTVGSGANVHIFPPAGEEERVFASISKAHPHMRAYRKSEIPARLHFSSHRRIPPILVTADEGWFLRPRKSNRVPPRGYHGYDNRHRSMHGIFAARGPDFAQGLVVESVEAIDLYNLMAAVLSISPARNRGNIGRVRSLLSSAAPSLK